ncbi:hypothetical protein A6R68_08081, partial [Neotoma lepida]
NVMVAHNVPKRICGMSYRLHIALSSVENTGSLASDARLHKDDTDICFSKTLNSCKVPQIRYASVERLLERLTDLRFLSIDFLNTFLHTYRIFTTATVVLAKLSDIYKRPFTSIPNILSSEGQKAVLDIFLERKDRSLGPDHIFIF